MSDKLIERAEKLRKELSQIEQQIWDTRIIGYKVCFIGDEYDFGGYEYYFIKDHGKRRAFELAQKAKKKGYDAYISKIFR